MATQAQILADVRSRLDEATSRQWSDPELRRWINEGARDIARRAEVLQDRQDVAITAGTQEYTLPTDTLRVYRVEWHPDNNTSIYPLEYRDFNSMDSVWWTSQSQAEGYPYWFTMWGYPPSLKIVIYPTPSSDGDLKIFYYRLPAELATASNADQNLTVEVPAGWEDLVALYCEFVALRKDADPRWQEAKSLYEQSLGLMMDTTRRWTDQAGAINHNNSFLPQWLWSGDY